MNKRSETSCPLDKGASGGAFKPDNQVTFPMPGDCSVFNFCWPFTDRDVFGDMSPGFLPGSLPWNAESPTSSKASDQFPFQSAPCLDVECLVCCLVADSHRFIIGEINPQPVRYLLWRPRAHRTPMSPVGLIAAVPGWTMRTDRVAVTVTNVTV